VGGRCILNSVDLTHSLKATCFEPLLLNINSWFQNVPLQILPAPLRGGKRETHAARDVQVGGLYKLNPVGPIACKRLVSTLLLLLLLLP
jgi:hypothetical protein